MKAKSNKSLLTSLNKTNFKLMFHYEFNFTYEEA
jgi:hypothetical protein